MFKISECVKYCCFFLTLGLFGPGLISVNTTNSLLMLNGHSPNTLGSQQSSPNGQSPQVNWVTAAPCKCCWERLISFKS